MVIAGHSGRIWRPYHTAWPPRRPGHNATVDGRSGPHLFSARSRKRPKFNRRPVQETGGSRPTARCALGRKGVFYIGRPQGRPYLRDENVFDSLSERLNGILDRLTRRGALSEADVEAALREVRRALLEADVALDVARSFTEEVKRRAVGVDVIKSVTPGQMVVKIVHDQLIETLGSSAQPIDLNAPAPVVDHDGGTARLGQNHDHRQDRQAPRRRAQAQGADGLARHPPAGGDGAARRARQASRRRHAAGRRRTDAGADRRARATGGAARRL